MSLRIINADVMQGLAELPDESVHCVVTSPPYWGLRDYGAEGQIGLEPTLAQHIAKLVEVFREVRRVLRKDGTLWLNYGDAYAGAAAGGWREGAFAATGGNPGGRNRNGTPIGHGLKPKDLLMMPERLAIALQDDGWYVRSRIIWHKPNPMPESVTDRPTKSHEHIWLMSKQPRYFYDAEAIKEPATYGEPNSPGSIKSPYGQGFTRRAQRVRAEEIAKEKGLTEAHIAAIRAAGVSDTGKAQVTQTGYGKNSPEVTRLAAEAKAALGGYYREFLTSDDTRNARDVWTIATAPFTEAHFATFPPELAERCIKAGCPAGGTVLDPFGGSGTTGLVADRLQRNAILIELNPAYAAMAHKRLLSDAPLFAEVNP